MTPLHIRSVLAPIGLAGLLAGGVLVASVRADIVQERALLQPDPASVMYDEPGDGALYAVGRNWKARFAADGTSFIPFLGSDAAQDGVVRFGLATVHVGGTALELRTDVAATREAGTMRYARGGIEELYHAKPQGLEHVLVFTELAARGELVVRCTVETDLTAREAGDAVEFTRAGAGVRYSGALAWDAAGRRCALKSHWDGSAIVLTVPAEMTSDLPLTIDPLVEVIGVATTPDYELAPDASVVLGPSGIHRCEVFETIWSQSDHDVTARVTRLSDGAVTLHAVDATTDYWSRPKVASIWNSKIESEFGIVAAVGIPAQVSRSVRGRELRVHFQPPPVLAPVVTIGTGGGGDHHSPDVGGDPYIGGSGSGSKFLVVWERDDVNGDSDILAGGLIGNQTFTMPAPAADPAHDDQSPRLSKADGTVLWCIVWERHVSLTNTDIWSSTVPWDFASVSAPLAISTAPEDERHPTVSSLGLAGYVIAYERDQSGQHDVVVRVLAGTTVGAPENLTLLEGGTHAGLDQILPTVDGDGFGYVLACKETDPAVPGLFRTRLTGFAISAMGQVMVQEAHIPLGSPTTNRTRANVCSEPASTRASVLRFEVVWDEVAQSTSSDALAAIFTPGISAGVVIAGCFGDGSDTACPCGNNGGVPAGCPSSVQAHGAELLWSGEVRLSHDTFTVHGTRLPQNGVALLAQGTTIFAPAHLYGDGLLCIGGTQTRIATRPVSASGELTYPAISDPTISAAGSVPGTGGSRVYQVVYRNLGNFCTSATWNTTNALQVSWIP